MRGADINCDYNHVDDVRYVLTQKSGIQIRKIAARKLIILILAVVTKTSEQAWAHCKSKKIQRNTMQ